MTPRPRFRALHIPCDPGSDAPLLAAAAAAIRLHAPAAAAPPAPAAAAADWFFVRYAEGGPHLRIRLGPRARHAFDALLAAFPDAAERPYEPETQRYGGARALRLAETLFTRSTALALAALPAAPPGSAANARLGVDLMLAAAAAAVDGAPDAHATAALFFARYAAFWRDAAGFAPAPAAFADPARVRARLDALAAAAAPPATAPPAAPAMRWAADLRAARAAMLRLGAAGALLAPATGAPARGVAALEAAGVILGSHMHMMANRLGVSPLAEAALAAGLAAALAPETAAPAAAQAARA